MRSSKAAAAVSRGMRPAHQNLRSRILAQSFGPRQRIKQSHFSDCLKRKWMSHCSHHADRHAPVFRYRNRHHRPNQQFIFHQRLRDLALDLLRIFACRLNLFLQERKLQRPVICHPKISRSVQNNRHRYRSNRPAPNFPACRAFPGVRVRSFETTACLALSKTAQGKKSYLFHRGNRYMRISIEIRFRHFYSPGMAHYSTSLF